MMNAVSWCRMNNVVPGDKITNPTSWEGLREILSIEDDYVNVESKNDGSRKCFAIYPGATITRKSSAKS